MMISASSSGEILQTLLQTTAETRKNRIALLGIGNQFNGDDAAGVHLVHLLKSSLNNLPNLLFIDAGLAPQNFNSVVQKFEPHLVILFDAAEMGLSPGQLALIDPNDIDGMGASTHSFPLSLLVQYFELELHCPVQVIAVQVVQSEPFTDLSVPVRCALQQFADEFIEWFK